MRLSADSIFTVKQSTTHQGKLLTVMVPPGLVTVSASKMALPEWMRSVSSG